MSGRGRQRKGWIRLDYVQHFLQSLPDSLFAESKREYDRLKDQDGCVKNSKRKAA